MRRVLWSKEASRDLNELMSFIAANSEQNANLVGDRIERSAKNLGDMAKGHFGRVKDTYEVVVPRTPYIIAYTRSETTLVIVRVIHGARDWRDGAWPAEN